MAVFEQSVTLFLLIWLVALNMSTSEARAKCLSKPGRACSCEGKGFSKNPRIRWSPARLSRTEKILVTVDFTSPKTFDEGNVEIEAYLHGTNIPVGKMNFPFSCADIQKTVPSISCPIREGKRIKFRKAEVQLRPLIDHQGRFDIKAELTNNKGELVTCVRAHLHITS